MTISYKPQKFDQILFVGRFGVMTRETIVDDFLRLDHHI